MKITDNLKKDAIYIQKKDVLYLRDMFSLEFVTDELLNEKKINDFILVEGEDNVKIISSRDEILEQVWGDDYFGSDRAVDDLVRRLRKKCKDLNILTVYGYGYRLSL